MSTYYHDFKNDEFADKYIFKNMTNGYFVEVGACDGITSSQCYFFEKERDWNGITVEPQKRFNWYLKNNRKNPCFKCLGNTRDTVNFTESVYYGLSGITDILKDHEQIEPHKTEWRNTTNNYNVEMYTLLDLLEEYNSPDLIDFVGMDCEGSEFNILMHFFENNTKYIIKFICLEVGRSDLVDLVLQNNYIELINPILPDYDGKPITWEKYFIHNAYINTIDKNLIKQ